SQRRQSQPDDDVSHRRAPWHRRAGGVQRGIRSPRRPRLRRRQLLTVPQVRSEIERRARGSRRRRATGQTAITHTIGRFGVLLTLLAAACQTPAAPKQMLKYPVARKDGTVDDFSGAKVADPYRWMESLDSKDVADWVAASNAVTEPYLASLPLRDHFRTRLTELWNYPRTGVPTLEGGRIFYARNSGLQKQAPVFM